MYTADPDTGTRFNNALILTALNLLDIIFAYLLAYWIIPRTLGKSSWNTWLAVLVVLSSVGGFALLDGYFFSNAGHWIREHSGFLSTQQDRLGIWRNVPEAIYSMSFFTAVVYLRSWYKHSKELKRLVDVKDFNERLQLDQHSLLNIVKTLYTRAYRKRDSVADELYALVHLLRYVVYDYRRPLVSLEAEKQMLDQYVKLKKKSYDGKMVYVDMKCSINEDNKDKIVPMLLLPLLENAFKHGADQATDMCKIRVRLQQPEPGVVHFECRNTKPRPREGSEKDQPAGAGLILFQQRLDVCYPGNYLLDTVKDDPQYYKVSLTIILKNGPFDTMPDRRK